MIDVSLDYHYGFRAGNEIGRELPIAVGVETYADAKIEAARWKSYGPSSRPSRAYYLGRARGIMAGLRAREDWTPEWEREAHAAR